MSWPKESGTPPLGPVVHPPHAAPDRPSYEQYADPAEAHGWADGAYDATTELPRVAPPAPTGGRADRRRARRKADSARTRRVAAAAGALGAVSAAALIAGFTFSRSDGTTPAKDGRPDLSTPDEASTPTAVPLSAAPTSAAPSTPGPKP
ncbi:hypothetical protein MTQ10_03860, partial [Streptomyces sp. XM83C]|nr:hypothetical protein [Streptomyces sp. XM83C]